MTPLEDLRSRRAQILDDLLEAKRSKNHPVLISKRQTLRYLDLQIAKLKSEETEVIVSDHAIVRYLERVEGVDIESIKHKILSGNASEQIATLGTGELPVKGESADFVLVFRNYTVATVQR